MPNPSATDRSPVHLRGSERRTFSSAATKVDYGINVASPQRPSSALVPTVYVPVDPGGTGFFLITSVMRSMLWDSIVPDVRVVGIEPRLPPEAGAKLREQAFEPEQAAAWLVQDILTQVIPFIESEYPADASRRVVVGHSWTGMLTLHMFLRGANEFCGYLASSPALWRLGNDLFAEESRLAERDPAPAGKLFLSVGELEQPPGHERGELFQMIDRMQWLAEALTRRNYPNLSVHSAVLPDQTHTTAFPVAICRGLWWILGRSFEEASASWPPVPAELRAKLEASQIPRRR